MHDPGPRLSDCLGKTSASIANIFAISSPKFFAVFPEIAYHELKKHLDQLKRNQGLIFTTSTGSPISPRNFIRQFKKALSNAGLPDISVHDLRHSHASLLLASGVNPKLVQERLGHASIESPSRRSGPWQN